MTAPSDFLVPPRKFKAIATSDTVPQAVEGRPLRGIYVGGAGNISIKDDLGVTTLLTAVPVGTVLDIGPRFVMATSTTATVMVGFY